jgi:3-oxoacyl-(acyl-carrier-protein) synthase
MENREKWQTSGARTVSPFFIANMLPDTASGQIAIETGIRGSNMCIVTACSTGTHNIGEAAEGIRRGDYIAALTGATENPLHEMVYIGFSNMRGMGMPRPGEPIETVSRPFDKTRDGFVLGEGSGAMMLEDLEYAKARGAKVYAEVVGYGSAADAWDLIQPIDKGDGARRAFVQALERHNVPADEVDLINPHGTSTPLGDLREAQAIWGAFGDHTPDIAISGTKSMTGHLMGAAGAIEGVMTVLSVYNQCAPQTLNYREEDPEINLDVVKDKSRSMEIRYAVSNNIGLGGHNGAVIFKRYDGD